VIFLIFAFIVVGTLLLGNGALFSSIIRLNSVRNPFLYFWLGIFFTSTLAMFASFFVPLNNFALACFTLLGIGGLPKFIKDFRENFAEIQRSKKILFALFSFVTIIAVCRYLGFTPLSHNYAYDTALYHANAVQWLNEFGAVFGLGNLHSRLGMNSLWLTFAAILDNFIFNGRTSWILPSLCLIGGFLFFGYEIFKTSSRKIAVFCAVFLSFIIFMQLVRPIQPILGIYFDLVVFFVYAITVLEVYCFVIQKRTKESIPILSCILVLAVFSFMLKQIGAINCIFAFLFVLYVLLSNRESFVKNAIKVFLPAGLAFLVMIANNAVLSGYLFFPLQIFAMPFDWTMPKELVKGTYEAVVYWARLPGPLYMTVAENGFWYWFEPWLVRHNTKFNWVIYVIPFVLSFFLWAKTVLIKRDKTAIFFLIWSFANILFWFNSAPDLRFGAGFFFVNIALALMFFVRDTDFTVSLLWDNKLSRKIICILTCAFIVALVIIPFSRHTHSILTIGKMGSEGVHEYKVNNVDNPYYVWVPNKGDQVGNSPLPATPYPKILETYGIEMRNKDFLGAGFRATRQ